VHAIASEIILASRRHSRYEGLDEEQEIIMGFKFAIAVACVCVGALTLAGCNRDQANNQQPAAPGAVAAGGQQTGTAMPPAGDLSPESNQKFLADNSKMTGVTVRPSGLQYRVIKAGAGKSPTPNDQVTVTYKGSLITGQVFDLTFKSGDKLKEPDLERRKINFLYATGDEFHFMEEESYEQYHLGRDTLGDAVRWLSEGTTLRSIVFEGRVVGVELPQFVEMLVTETGPGGRSDMASGKVTKSATLANGTEIRVPVYLEAGETVVVDTTTGDFVKRVAK